MSRTAMSFPDPTPEDPHPWYGPCDGFGANGECSECRRLDGKPQFEEPGTLLVRLQRINAAFTWRWVSMIALGTGLLCGFAGLDDKGSYCLLMSISAGILSLREHE